ncbi:MAG: endolytic transglycosylase MltG [Methylococcales bacterium]
MVRKKITKGRVRKTFVLLVLMAIIAVGLLWQHYQAFADKSLMMSSDERILSVESGDGFHNVLKKLRGLGVNQGNDLEWKALSREMKVASHMQVGDYAITSGLSPRTILQRIKDGDIIQRKFALIDGWNFRDLRKALKNTSHIEHVTDELSDTELMAKLGAEAVHPEGRFLPETYLYSRGTSDFDLLQRAYKGMQDALAEAWGNRQDGLPLSNADELLTLASIIEKETGAAEERPMIAGVFIRRLNVGMRLQTDPTVIYGIGSVYDGNIRKKDLQTDTPYNTYTRDGLPPTPIAMPGKPALEAAAQPADGDAVFFVARGDGSGRHVFSKDLNDHNAAVRQYLKNIR